jgi:Holliday junction resolvase
MASTPEKRVKEKVVAILKSEGVYYFFPATHGYGRSGVPDIIACVNGHFVGIECKAGGNKPTVLQERELTAIRDNGGVAVVVDEMNWDITRDIVRRMKTSIIGGEG